MTDGDAFLPETPKCKSYCYEREGRIFMVLLVHFSGVKIDVQKGCRRQKPHRRLQETERQEEAGFGPPLSDSIWDAVI